MKELGLEPSWYEGTGKIPDAPVTLPSSPLEAHADPRGYLADKGLVDAVNVALYLGQPLLLTGAPGTGKTQLAYSLASELGLGEPLKFETRSTSAARDLFYTYDALGRFHAAHAQEGSAEPLDYIHWSALGQAILRANEPEAVASLLRDPARHGGRCRSVVLIDEIDKAPRDFPNDLLNEVEGMYFRVPELSNVRVAADAEMRPVVILTSNSEKNLAEAFLRRCVFYDIPFPSEDRLRLIVASRLGNLDTRRELIDDALELFAHLREPSLGLLKKPSTGELLAWLRLLTAGPLAAGESGMRDARLVEPTLCALVKTAEDRRKARPVVTEWMRSTRG